MRLNIGRGGRLGGKWASVDIDEALSPDIVDDVRTLDKIENESSAEIFASHVLEHIDEVQVLGTLKTWHGKLAPGGKLTVYVPDVERAWHDYSIGEADEKQVLVTMIGAEPTRSPYQVHRTMFWPKRLKGLLCAAGFSKVVPAKARKRPYEFGFQAVKDNRGTVT